MGLVDIFYHLWRDYILLLVPRPRTFRGSKLQGDVYHMQFHRGCSTVMLLRKFVNQQNASRNRLRHNYLHGQTGMI